LIEGLGGRLRELARPFGSFRRVIAGAAAVAVLALGCAERMGKNAAAGAVTALQEQRAAAEADPSKQPSRVAGGRAVEGAVAALDAPEQREAIRRLIAEAVSTATTTAVETATRKMVEAFGPDGRGPLAVSLARTGEQVSASVVGGVGNEIASLFPQCTGDDRVICIQRELQAAARASAASFTKGVEDSVAWHVMLIVFSLGALGGVLGAWLWSLRPSLRRRSFRTA